MPVKRVRVDHSLEKQILCGMIVSDQFLRDITPIYNHDYLEISYASIIATWCLRFYERYEKAPGKAIQQIFNHWTRTNPNPEQQIFIEEFLATLSDEFEHSSFNADYLLDKAVSHFKARSLKNLAEDIEHSLSQNDVEEAENALNEFRHVEITLSNGIDPLDDESVIKAAFEEKQEPLFKVPGKLGELMNDQLVRDSFIFFLAPEKRGKTWLMQFFADQARRARCNVAVFQLGDMSEKQYVRRQHISLAGKSDLKKYCGDILVPVLDCELNQKDICNRKERKGEGGVYEDGVKGSFDDYDEHIPCIECSRMKIRQNPFKGAVWYYLRKKVEPLCWKEAYDNGVEYKKLIRSKGFKLVTHSSDSCSISMIDSQLKKWEEQEDFIVDVLILDYMDIAASEGGNEDSRNQINKKWKRARRLSQDRHLCLISCSQADAASYYIANLTKSNFSEDKRIFAHVTAAYALNQTEEEKDQGLCRVAPLVTREDAYRESYNVTIGQSLACGKPYLFSY